MARVEGSSRNDKLVGTETADTFTAKQGNDKINGQGGTDTAIFSGNYEDYRVKHEGGEHLKVGVHGPEGNDQLSDVEFLQFSNGTYDVIQHAFIPKTTPPTLPAVSVTGVTVGATEGSGQNLQFAFERTGDLSQPLTASFTTYGATSVGIGFPNLPFPFTIISPATPGEDFTPASGTVEFSPGIDQVILELMVVDDPVQENNRLFQAEGLAVELLASSDYQLGAGNIMGAYIRDNDIFI